MRGRLFAPVPGLPAQAHLEHSLHDSFVPQSRPSPSGAVRDTERITEEIGGALFAGVTGGNSPHLLGNIEMEKSEKKSLEQRVVIFGTIDPPRNRV